MKVQDILEAGDLSRKTQSTALNRALKQAYAQFPAAKNDTEAFASWAMAKQAAADDLINRQAELNRRQDAVISTLDSDNADQEQKLQALDQENDELAANLGQVEKRLGIAAKKDTSAPQTAPEPAKAKDVPAGATAIVSPYAAPANNTPAKDKKSAPADNKKTPNANLPAVSDPNRELAGTHAFSTMVPQLGQQQKQLPLDYSPADNIYMPARQQQQLDPRWASGRGDITDIDTAGIRDIAKTVAQDPDKFKRAMGMNETNKDHDKSEPPEADYGDDYQQMVLRLKKLAGAGPLKTVYDPKKRVYKNVPTAVQPPKK